MITTSSCIQYPVSKIRDIRYENEGYRNVQSGRAAGIAGTAAEKERKGNMRKGRLLAWGMAAAMVLSFMTGCKSGNEGGSSSAGAQENTQKSASSAGETPAAKDGNKETITLRIGSGHSESNP